ncbi:recombination protein NinG, partial [Huaxiibacter chinensis]|uniref:recombination protein NinG n=1 Tax=Huaxiibacter chinensis TaxID=2899785 RepID=UPI003D31F15C
MRKPARRTCKICKTKFTATFDNVWWCCPEHGFEYSQQLLAKKKIEAERKRKQEAQQERRELKIRKKALQPLSQYHKRAQIAFNAFIRQRDAGQPCISCGR